MENLKMISSKMKVSLTQRINMVVDDVGVIYKGDLMNRFGMTEDMSSHGEFHRALIDLASRSKIEIIQRGKSEIIKSKRMVLQ